MPGSASIGAGGGGSGDPAQMVMVRNMNGHEAIRSLQTPTMHGGAPDGFHQGTAPGLGGNFVDPVFAASTTAPTLPVSHDDYGNLVPGSKVPTSDRKWVYNPQAHDDTAPNGVTDSPMSRFTLSPRTIGSTSVNGTIAWEDPHPVRHKKRPLGGDGTGLLGMYYLGNAFQKLVMMRPDRNIDFDWTNVSPDRRVLPQHEYSVRWLGKLVPPSTGVYTISTASDDGERVYIDGKLIISNWTVHPATQDSGVVNLEAGREYALKVEYFENAYGPAIMRMYWTGPGVPLEYIPEQCLRYPKSLVHKN